MERYEDKNTRVGAEVSDKTLSFELNGEISLPDYLGEVSRLLWVRPTVLPPAKFLNGQNAEFSGRVCYQALYADPGGALFSVTGEDTYSFSVPTEAESTSMLTAQVVPDAVVGRVAAPRRITVRCRLHAHVCGYAEKNIGTVLPAEIEGRVCRLGAPQQSGRFLAAVGDAVELYDEIDIDTAEPVRVIAARGEVFLPEVTAVADAVSCRGEVIVTLLCCRTGAESGENGEGEHQAPYTITRRLPLACEVPLDEVSSGCEVRAMATVSEVRAVAEEGKITVAVRAVPQVEAACLQLAYYTKDLFMPDMQAECRYTEARVWQPRGASNRHFSVLGSFTPAELGMPSQASIVDACAEAEVRERSTNGKSTLLVGEVHCHILYQHGKEYGVCEGAVPFRAESTGDFETLSTTSNVPLCHVQYEGERVRIEGEVVIAMRASSFTTVAPVSEARFLEGGSSRGCDLELCYPTAGDTLWSVAKRYAVSPERIAAQNGISDEDLEDATLLSSVHYLMIP